MLLLRALVGCALAVVAARDGASEPEHLPTLGFAGPGAAPRERPRGRELSVTDFGGSAAPGHNNAAAIAAAGEACRRNSPAAAVRFFVSGSDPAPCLLLYRPPTASW